MYANALFRKDPPTSETHSQSAKRLSRAYATALAVTSLSITTLTGYSDTLSAVQISQPPHGQDTATNTDRVHTSDCTPASIHDPLSLTELLCPSVCLASANDLFSCHGCNQPALDSGPALFDKMGVFHHAAQQAAKSDGGPPSTPLSPTELGLTRSTRDAVLEVPAPRVPEPWAFEGNGGYGVKTWLSEAHVIEINPRWLDFAMFESMDLSMTEDPPGPGQTEPQEWRNAFTVGMATDWQFTRNLALHAGYRFYSNPIPNDTTSGAFPDADQHIVACGMSFTEGRHSVSLIYGLDVMAPSGNSGISSARYGDEIESLAHLLTVNYGFSF